LNKWTTTRRKTPANQLNKRPALTGGGFAGRARYYVDRALKNIRQNVFVNVVTIGTIALSLLIVALFALVFFNIKGLADHWSDQIQVTAYFDHELTSGELSGLRAKIGVLPEVSHINYVSRDEAMKRFRSRLRGQESLLDGVTSEILPTSMEITLKRSHRDTQSVENFVSALKKIPGINEMQYGEEWVKRFNLFLNFMRVMGALLGIFLIVSALFIVSNTIKLTIYARRDELEVMSLVGATRFFIKAPFLIEGIIQGGAGALLAILMLFGLYELFAYNADTLFTFNSIASGLSFLPVEYLGAIFLSGIALGFVGSLTSLRRFITI